jgi:hypothetical protein
MEFSSVGTVCTGTVAAGVFQRFTVLTILNLMFLYKNEEFLNFSFI